MREDYTTFFVGACSDRGENDEKERKRRAAEGGGRQRREDAKLLAEKRLPMTYVCRQSRVARLRNYWNTSCVRNKWRNMPWKVLVQDHPAIQETLSRSDFITVATTSTHPRLQARIYVIARGTLRLLSIEESRTYLPSILSIPLPSPSCVKAARSATPIFHSGLAKGRRCPASALDIHSGLRFTQLCVP